MKSAFFILSIFFILRLLMADYYFKRGVISEERENYKSALNLFETSSNLNPFLYEPLMKAGKIMNIRGDYQKAIFLNLRALRNFPNNEYIYNNLGVSFRGAKEFQKSVICFEKAISFDPGFREALLNLAGVCMEKGDYGYSFRIYKDLLQNGDRSFIIFKNLGDIHSIQGDYEQAEEYYKMGFEINPEDPFLLSNYARVLFVREMWDYAKELTLKSLDLSTSLVQPRYLLAEIYERENDLTNALEQYKILIESDNNSINLRLKIKELEDKIKKDE